MPPVYFVSLKNILRQYFKDNATFLGSKSESTIRVLERAGTKQALIDDAPPFVIFIFVTQTSCRHHCRPSDATAL